MHVNAAPAALCMDVSPALSRKEAIKYCVPVFLKWVICHSESRMVSDAMDEGVASNGGLGHVDSGVLHAAGR